MGPLGEGIRVVSAHRTSPLRRPSLFGAAGDAKAEVSHFVVGRPGASALGPEIPGGPFLPERTAVLNKQGLSLVPVGAGGPASSLACSVFDLTQKQFDLESEEGIPSQGICSPGSRSG